MFSKYFGPEIEYLLGSNALCGQIFHVVGLALVIGLLKRV